MKIIRELDITTNEFYDYIENMICTEFKTSTGRELNSSSIKKGLTFSRKNKKAKTEVHVLVNDYKRGEKYSVTSKSVADTAEVTYTTEALGDNKLKVTLTENLSSFDPTAHNVVLRLFSQAAFLGRMASTISDIEQAIINNRTYQKD